MSDIEVVPVETKKVDRRLWENSPLNGSSIDELVSSDPDQFFNRKNPNLAVVHEKPEHRLMIMLKLQGYSNVEIAKITEYTISHVGQVLRQPWARDRILAELNKAGREGIANLLEGSVADSIFTIVELRDTAEDEGVRLRAAQDLIDRHLGKPTQRLESQATVRHVGATVAEVEAELKKVEEEMAKLLPEQISPPVNASS